MSRVTPQNNTRQCRRTWWFTDQRFNLSASHPSNHLTYCLACSSERVKFCCDQDVTQTRQCALMRGARTTRRKRYHVAENTLHVGGSGSNGVLDRVLSSVNCCGYGAVATTSTCYGAHIYISAPLCKCACLSLFLRPVTKDRGELGGAGPHRHEEAPTCHEGSE